MIKKIFSFFVCSLLLSSCSIIEHKDQLLALKRLGDDQARQEQFLKRQEKKFQLLLSDYEKGRLKQGTAQKKILSRYGEPVSFKEQLEDQSGVTEEFVYRHPEQFFGSEKIYLYFNKDSKLINWQYQPAAEDDSK
jgi:hypothetical protein